MDEEEKKEEKEKERDSNTIVWRVPVCCREGWDSCPHSSPKNPKKEKRNIGL